MIKSEFVKGWEAAGLPELWSAEFNEWFEKEGEDLIPCDDIDYLRLHSIPIEEYVNEVLGE